MVALYWPLLLMMVKTSGSLGSLYRMLPATSEIDPAAFTVLIHVHITEIAEQKLTTVVPAKS